MSDTKESLKEAELAKSSVSGDNVSSSNVDTAWKFLDANRDVAEATASESELKALRRKIDWHIVPIMFCCYTMQFLDKVILNVSDPPCRSLTRLAPIFGNPPITVRVCHVSRERAKRNEADVRAE